MNLVKDRKFLIKRAFSARVPQTHKDPFNPQTHQQQFCQKKKETVKNQRSHIRFIKKTTFINIKKNAYIHLKFYKFFT